MPPGIGRGCAPVPSPHNDAHDADPVNLKATFAIGPVVAARSPEHGSYGVGRGWSSLPGGFPTYDTGPNVEKSVEFCDKFPCDGHDNTNGFPDAA
jgi:hypothetical protein